MSERTLVVIYYAVFVFVVCMVMASVLVLR